MKRRHPRIQPGTYICLLPLLFGLTSAISACDGAEEVDSCASVTCSEHGYCTGGSAGPVCVCDNGYRAEGSQCLSSAEPCEGVTCSGHGACSSLGADAGTLTAECRCEIGYHTDGLACVADEGPCAGISCSGHGTCAGVGDAPQCACETGYHADALTCVADESPCADISCSGHGTCSSADGSPVCDCDLGYHSDSLTCIVDVDPCLDIVCSGHGTCSASSGAPQCQCDDGYVTEGLGCIQDIDMGTLIFSEGFESGDISQWRCSGNCPTVVESPVFDGTYAGSFDLTRDMSTSYRTEAVVQGGMRFEFGQEYWITMRYLFEHWDVDSAGDSAPLQIHTTPSDWSTDCGSGSAYSNAPFFMYTNNGISRFVTYGGVPLWEIPVETRTWLNISIHFRVSTGSDGFIETWRDGVMVGRVDGRNNSGVDGCGEPQRLPYLKIGVYKWPWREGRPATDSTRRQLFIDEVAVYQVGS